MNQDVKDLRDIIDINTNLSYDAQQSLAELLDRNMSYEAAGTAEWLFSDELSEMVNSSVNERLVGEVSDHLMELGISPEKSSEIAENLKDMMANEMSYRLIDEIRARANPF